jgi:DNA-binding NarL/FixJ family response regulator
MAGGTLMVSRAINLHGHYQKKLEGLGFREVIPTAADRDALVLFINEKKPRLVMMAAAYYYSATAFMISKLIKQFPDIIFAVISVSEYPADLAAGFIANGVKSYVSYWDGEDQFYKGLERVRDGKEFISYSVQERLEMRGEMPETVGRLTKRELEIVRLLCNGFKTSEIMEVLHISEPTVNNHKAAIYPKLNVRNVNEIIRTALTTKIVTLDELIFNGRDQKTMLNEQETSNNKQRGFYVYKN